MKMCSKLLMWAMVVIPITEHDKQGDEDLKWATMANVSNFFFLFMNAWCGNLGAYDDDVAPAQTTLLHSNTGSGPTALEY